MGNQVAKTINAVLQDEPFDDDGPQPAHSDASLAGSSLPSNTHSPTGAHPTEGAPNLNGTPIPTQEPVEEIPTRVEYSTLLQLIKSKDFTKAMVLMEADVEEYGRFLRAAKESHITSIDDAIRFVIRDKFFDCVKTNNKHASAIYSVLYMALEMDSTEALQFLVLHTCNEFDAACSTITKPILSTARNVFDPSAGNDDQEHPDKAEKDESAQPSAVDPSSDHMTIVNGLSKMFEVVARIMNEYAYVESFGLKRILLILRAMQPILEKYAMELLSHWLKASHFDEYALNIPSNDWQKYEDYQLGKLQDTAKRLNPANASAEQGVPSVRVGGKVDPKMVVVCLDQFSAMSQVIESYKTYIHRQYEKGIEEMKAKGHSFVDAGETLPAYTHNSSITELVQTVMVPQIANETEMVHNIRSYVAEPTQLFLFLSRKSESFKQLETWFLGSSLLEVFNSQSDATSTDANNKKLEDSAKKEGTDPKNQGRDDRSSELGAASAAIAAIPTADAIFSAQKIDHVFSLLIRSIERSVASRQVDVSKTLLKRALSFTPSFLLSLFLRQVKAALPKNQLDSNSADITAAILEFHGEEQDTPKKITPAPVAPKAASSWASSLGGLMSFVGNNAVASASSVIASSSSMPDSVLVNAPKPVVWDYLHLCASVNDLYLCSVYFTKLHGELGKKIKYYEKTEANRAQLLPLLELFKTSVPTLFTLQSTLQAMLHCVIPGMTYHLHQFYRTSYEMAEEEYKAAEINDPWAAVANSWLIASLKPFSGLLQPAALELLVQLVAATFADHAERLILRKRFSAFGALALDSHIRVVQNTFVSLLPTTSAFSVRHKFATLKEILTVLCLESEKEIVELWNASHEDPSQLFDPTLATVDPNKPTKTVVKWHLTAERVKAYLKCRTEFRGAVIDSFVLETR